MYIACAICTEILSNSDCEVHSTPCGHLFHLSCLSKWLKTSKTCPQCRSKCLISSTTRIYFNQNVTSSACNSSFDVAVLEKSIDKTDLELQENAFKIIKLKAERQKISEECSKARARADISGKLAERADLNLESVKNKYKYYAIELKRLKACEELYNKISSKAKLIDRIDEVIRETPENAEKIVDSENNASNLKHMSRSIKDSLRGAVSRQKVMRTRFEGKLNDLKLVKQATEEIEQKCLVMEKENNHLKEKHKMETKITGSEENSLASPELKQVLQAENSVSSFDQIKLSPCTPVKRNNLQKKQRPNASYINSFKEISNSPEPVQIEFSPRSSNFPKKQRPNVSGINPFKKISKSPELGLEKVLQPKKSLLFFDQIEFSPRSNNLPKKQRANDSFINPFKKISKSSEPVLKKVLPPEKSVSPYDQIEFSPRSDNFQKKQRPNACINPCKKISKSPELGLKKVLQPKKSRSVFDQIEFSPKSNNTPKKQPLNDSFFNPFRKISKSPEHGLKKVLQPTKPTFSIFDQIEFSPRSNNPPKKQRPSDSFINPFKKISKSPEPPVLKKVLQPKKSVSSNPIKFSPFMPSASNNLLERQRANATTFINASRKISVPDNIQFTNGAKTIPLKKRTATSTITLSQHLSEQQANEGSSLNCESNCHRQLLF